MVSCAAGWYRAGGFETYILITFNSVLLFCARPASVSFVSIGLVCQSPSPSFVAAMPCSTDTAPRIWRGFQTIPDYPHRCLHCRMSPISTCMAGQCSTETHELVLVPLWKSGLRAYSFVAKKMFRNTTTATSSGCSGIFLFKGDRLWLPSARNYRNRRGTLSCSRWKA